MTAEMSGEEGLDAMTLVRADAVADRAVQEAGAELVSALENGNVTEIERSFYRVFRRIYLDGVRDGRSGR